MAQILSVPVYKINSRQVFNGPVYIGIAYAQMQSVWPLSGDPNSNLVSGNYVYSVINTTGTTQFPGNSYYTSLLAANIISGS